MSHIELSPEQDAPAAPSPSLKPSQPMTAFQTAREMAFPKFSTTSATVPAVLFNVLFYIVLRVSSLFTYTTYNCMLYNLGALYPPDLKSLQLHRLVVPSLMHFSFWHLFINSLAALSLGFETEDILGKSRTLTLCIGASVYGFLFSAVGYPHTLVAGASAGIMGMFGFHLARAFLKKPAADKKTYAIFGLLIIYSLFLYFSPRNGNLLTHFGGLLFGLLYGVINDPPTEAEMPQIKWLKRYAEIAMAALPALWTLTFILMPISRDPICVS